MSKNVLKELIYATEVRSEKTISGERGFTMDTGNLEGDISNIELKERLQKLELMQSQLLSQMRTLIQASQQGST